MSTSTETEHDEWSEPYYVKGQGWLIADTQGCFAQVRNEATAEQIVADHNSLQSLTAQLESQASTLARVVRERDALRRALREIASANIEALDDKLISGQLTRLRVATSDAVHVLQTFTTTTGQEEG